MLMIPCFFLVSLGTALIGLSTKLEAEASTRLFFVAMVRRAAASHPLEPPALHPAPPSSQIVRFYSGEA